ncbi:hypothetical protein MFUM_1020026 [Methylacidiphilum fumariolicum SolV]|uniref:Uncharacterized protein n=2 Tax=Candidatus Methylacidiphilum fumarolicum TaxID=591154 RepID=I0JVN4_METFB|nr:conserved protein of unknown function [Candidatus Methylacidiphilum fumarolicum]CCG91303.1 hypothetical protein MFUM_1020026 [Methylacidiphilum fumariolicum SolV]
MRVNLGCFEEGGNNEVSEASKASGHPFSKIDQPIERLTAGSVRSLALQGPCLSRIGLRRSKKSS